MQFLRLNTVYMHSNWSVNDQLKSGKGERGALSIPPKLPVWISRNFQWRMGHNFPEFSGKRKHSRSIPKFSKTFYREFGSLQFWDQYLHFENSTIFGFSEKNFPRTFSYHLAAFKRLRSFQIEWKVSWFKSEVRRFKMWSENEQIHIPLRIKLANSSSLSLS